MAQISSRLLYEGIKVLKNPMKAIGYTQKKKWK
jgi:hypothetical protein